MEPFFPEDGVFSYTPRPKQKDSNLDLGWCQGYWCIPYHLRDAFKEKTGVEANISDFPWDPPKMIFSRRYLNTLKNLNKEKIHDFCFIGAFNNPGIHRKWVIEFAKKYFTGNSVFINTDHPADWVSLGPWDYTGKIKGYNPMSQPDKSKYYIQYEDQPFYFQTMSNSKFGLVPRGDSSWTFRIYETLACGLIPIVESWHHLYRTEEESKIDFEYILVDFEKDSSQFVYDKNAILYNYSLFEKHFLL